MKSIVCHEDIGETVGEGAEVKTSAADSKDNFCFLPNCSVPTT